MSATAKDHKPAKPAKTSKKTAAKALTYAVETETVGNYEKHPFFIKKANKAKETLKKVGLPANFKLKAS